MPVLALKDLQPTLRTIALGAPLLAGEAVIVDAGQPTKEAELALAERGLVVIVGPLVRLSRVDSVFGATIGEAELVLEVLENPLVNAGRGKDAPTVATQLVQAVQTWEPSPGERSFGLGNPIIELLAMDPGLRILAVNVRKTVQIA